MLSINDIVKIFEEIELRLVRSLKLNLSRHKAEEQEYGFDWSAWQAEKLRSLQEFRRTNAAIMAQYTSQIDNDTRQIMQAEFAEGMNGVDAPPDSPQFFGVDNTKVNKLIDDITYLEKNAETAALRMTDDVYRQTVNRVQLAMGTGSMTLQQAIDIAVKDFLNQGINCIMYKDGRRVNIADYVRMALRTTATRATLQGKSAKFKALGYDTVQVSQYSMCSETCEPYQGRIYIEDTFSLWDGEVQEQGDMLWGKSNYCGKWFPLLSEAIRKGLFHPNCRHTILMWRDGDPIPESINNEDSERRYKLEQQQRKLENAVRKAKRKVEGLSDPENVKKAKAELRETQKQLKDFIDKVNADEGEAILKRDYGKEKIYSDIPKKLIDNTGESGIINKKIRFYSINEESDNIYTEEEIEAEMQKSPIGQYISECVEYDGYSIEMNYDVNAPLYECGTVNGKNISVNVINHFDAADIAGTIIHEVAHKKFNWDVTQEDEVNCRIYEYLHSHKTISESKIKSIVDYVRENYSEDPEGDLYGY